MIQWQPIETAPKDGRIVIVARAGKLLRVEYVATARWKANFDRFDPEWGMFKFSPTH